MDWLDFSRGSASVGKLQEDSFLWSTVTSMVFFRPNLSPLMTMKPRSPVRNYVDSLDLPASTFSTMDPVAWVDTAPRLCSSHSIVFEVLVIVRSALLRSSRARSSAD